MDEIRIDIAPYFREHGNKPSGRGYWSFLIVSHLVTVKDRFHAPQDELTFKGKCK